MILSFLFFTFVAYLIFKLVFDFVIPVYKTTMQVKQKFRDMNQHMRGGQTDQNTQQKNNTETKKPTVGEYIDFEEVKDK